MMAVLTIRRLEKGDLPARVAWFNQEDAHLHMPLDVPFRWQRLKLGSQQLSSMIRDEILWLWQMVMMVKALRNVWISQY